MPYLNYRKKFYYSGSLLFKKNNKPMINNFKISIKENLSNFFKFKKKPSLKNIFFFKTWNAKNKNKNLHTYMKFFFKQNFSYNFCTLLTPNLIKNKIYHTKTNNFFYQTSSLFFKYNTYVFLTQQLNLKTFTDYLYFYNNNYISTIGVNKNMIFLLSPKTHINKKHASCLNFFFNNTRYKKLVFLKYSRYNYPILLKFKKTNNFFIKVRAIFNFWLKYKFIKKFSSYLRFSNNYSYDDMYGIFFLHYSTLSQAFFLDMIIEKQTRRKFLLNSYLLTGYDSYLHTLTRIGRDYPNIDDSGFFFFDRKKYWKRRIYHLGYLSRLVTMSFLSEQNINLVETLYFNCFFFKNTNYTEDDFIFKLNYFQLPLNFFISPVYLTSVAQTLNLEFFFKRCVIDKTNLVTFFQHSNLTYHNSFFFKKKNFKSYFPISLQPVGQNNHLNDTFNNFFTLTNLLISPFFFKFYFHKLINGFSFFEKTIQNTLSSFVDSFFFYNRLLSEYTNINPSNTFFFFLKKQILKISSYQKMALPITMWYANTLVRFIEHCTGKKVLLKFFMFLNNFLTFNEKLRCIMWSQKVKSFRRLLGPRLFLSESMQILYIALKLRDAVFFSNWLVVMFQKISFWKYKVLLRYLKYVLRFFFWAVFTEIGITRIKIQLKGKVSVAGNARTRTVLHRIGETSHATFENKISSTLTLVRTFTGVQGLKVWFFF